MADFCKQCSIDTFGEDSGDFKNIRSRLLTKEELSEGMGWPVLCEGCGSTLVNDDGECISFRCLHRHGGKNND